VAVIAIGLALTALVALFILPWVWNQIVEWLPITDSAVPATPPPTPTPGRVSLAGRSTDSFVLPLKLVRADIIPA
jgi:hypothetical protein